MNKRKRKGTNKRKRFPSKPDIPPQIDIPTQNCLVALQANKAILGTLAEQPELTRAA